jgi:hypothetical protein
MSVPQITLDEFFCAYPASRPIFDALQEMLAATGPCEMRITKSQVSFRRRKAFAWAWIPARYLHGETAPLVLSLSLPGRDPSPRWKEVVEPYPGRLMHHLELFTLEALDEEVRTWLTTAWMNAG